jgi:hypothetical protein
MSCVGCRKLAGRGTRRDTGHACRAGHAGHACRAYRAGRACHAGHAGRAGRACNRVHSVRGKGREDAIAAWAHIRVRSQRRDPRRRTGLGPCSTIPSTHANAAHEWTRLHEARELGGVMIEQCGVMQAARCVSGGQMCWMEPSQADPRIASSTAFEACEPHSRRLESARAILPGKRILLHFSKCHALVALLVLAGALVAIPCPPWQEAADSGGQKPAEPSRIAGIRDATEVSTGVSARPSAGPWLMHAGTPTAHVMIALPARPPGERR